MLAAYEATAPGPTQRSGTPAVIEQDTSGLPAVEGSGDGAHGHGHQQGQIVKSNAKITANAEAYLRNGDKNAFVEKMKTLNGTPEQIEQRIRTGLEEGAYNEASNKMDSFRELPPAEALVEYEAFIEDLNAKFKDEDGNEKYQEWESEEGGMAYRSRVALLSTANARKREAQRAMDVVGYNFAKSVANGTGDRTQLDALLKSGDIDDATAAALEPIPEG
jgi:hypothetical protein